MSDSDKQDLLTLSPDLARKYVAVASLVSFALALAVNAPALVAPAISGGLPELGLPPVRAIRLAPEFGLILAWLGNAASSALVVVLVMRLSGCVFCGAAAGLFFAVHPVHFETIGWSDARAVPVAAAFAIGASLLWFWNNRPDATPGGAKRPGPARIAVMGCSVGLLAIAGYLAPIMGAVPVCVWGASSVRGRIRGQNFLARQKHWPILLTTLLIAVYGAVRRDIPHFFREGELGGFAAWVDILGSSVAPWRLLPDYRPLYADAGAGLVAYGLLGLVAVFLAARKFKRFPAVAGGMTWVVLMLVFSLSIDHVYRADWAQYLVIVGVGWTVGEALALLTLRRWVIATSVIVVALSTRTLFHYDAWSSTENVLEKLEWLPVKHHGRIAIGYSRLGEARGVHARAKERKAAQLESESRKELAGQIRAEAAELKISAKEMAGRARKAAARAEMAVGRDDPSILAMRGEVLFRAGDYVRARDLLTRATEARIPKELESRLLVLLGEICVRSGDIATATSKYREATKANPLNANAHYKLGAALLAGDKAAEALKEFRESARLNPNDSGFQNALGRVFERMLRFDDAEAAYGRSVELSPGNEDYLRDLEAVRRMKEGRKTDAEAAKKAFDEGVVFQEQGRLMEAAEAYKRAAANQTGFHAAYYRAGLCRAAYGSRLRKLDERRQYLSQAVDHFKAALVWRPRHEPYLFALAQAYSDLGQAAKAEKVLLRLLAVNPRSGHAHYKLARLYAYAFEDVARARQQLDLAKSFGKKPEKAFIQTLNEIEQDQKAPPPSDEEKKADLAADSSSSTADVHMATGDAAAAAAAYARAYEQLGGFTRRTTVARRARMAWMAGVAWEKAKDLPRAHKWYVKAATEQPANRRYINAARRLHALVNTPVEN